MSQGASDPVDSGERPVPRQWPLSITVAMLLAVMCVLGLWALLMP